MSKLLHIPTGQFLRKSAFSAMSSSEMTKEELEFLLDFIKSSGKVSMAWNDYFNISLPLLPSEVEVIE